MRKSRYSDENIIGYLKQPKRGCRSRNSADNAASLMRHFIIFKWRARFVALFS